ncbi:hypothetical protein JMA_37980 (plasmid) [Jeotgalibacillus malaysiensis]|uniref:Uncharacterized protein n=1 Tax=Jeotgalibacillus malaysiensis TaxID=1508404 RepID=A0A0B5ASL0_9BACL|nr:hypothetical protein [Jeotgalibacillus malaysiensis]AJD93116.1 hypothetical protein JMA_37980 [Jeotgalibacillus malaysiensis]
MTINEYIASQDITFLKACFDELEAYQLNGVLQDGHVRKMNEEHFAGNVTTLHTIHFLVFQEIAKRHFKPELILSEKEKEKLRKELDKEVSVGSRVHYDCLNCSHSASTEDDQLICTVEPIHKQVQETHLCKHWN